jgi:hypothetical protein
VPVPLSTKDLDNDITKFAIKNQSPCIPLHGIVELFAVVMNRDESEIGNLMVFYCPGYLMFYVRRPEHPAGPQGGQVRVRGAAALRDLQLQDPNRARDALTHGTESDEEGIVEH